MATGGAVTVILSSDNSEARSGGKLSFVLAAWITGDCAWCRSEYEPQPSPAICRLGGATAVLVLVAVVAARRPNGTQRRQDQATKLLLRCSTLVISGKGQQLTRFLLPAAGFLGNLRSVVLRAVWR